MAKMQVPEHHQILDEGNVNICKQIKINKDQNIMTGRVNVLSPKGVTERYKGPEF